MGKKKKTDLSKLHRNTRRARMLREQMIEQLGGRCVGLKPGPDGKSLVPCGEDDPDKLEFDHKDVITWVARKKNYLARINQYRREIEQGLIQLLCEDCNRQKQRQGEEWRRELIDHERQGPF